MTDRRFYPGKRSNLRRILPEDDELLNRVDILHQAKQFSRTLYRMPAVILSVAAQTR